MRILVISLIGFIFLLSGCNNHKLGIKDPKAEILKVQKQMQDNQKMIANLKLPNQNMMQPPPVYKPPVMNVPPAPNLSKASGKTKAAE